jgi:hypothetical protein
MTEKELPIEYRLEYGGPGPHPVTGKLIEGTSLGFIDQARPEDFPKKGDLVTLEGVQYRVTGVDIEEEDQLDAVPPYRSIFCSATVVGA